jgi:hypothetical protein
MGYFKHFIQKLSLETTKQIIPAYVLLLTVNSYFQINLQTYQQMGIGQYGKGPMALHDIKFVNSLKLKPWCTLVSGWLATFPKNVHLKR